jgi:uncharacterized phage protein (TIGR01671 family)
MKRMRLLKLRVWDRTEKRFHYGGSCRELGENQWFFGLPIPHPDDCELMQFTGVIDNNGTEIYEGDVVAYYQNGLREISRIIFSDGMFRMERSSVDLQNWVDRNELEVIGNIYSTPALSQDGAARSDGEEL